jgi:hypothetical protein
VHHTHPVGKILTGAVWRDGVAQIATARSVLERSTGRLTEPREDVAMADNRKLIPGGFVNLISYDDRGNEGSLLVCLADICAIETWDDKSDARYQMNMAAKITFRNGRQWKVLESVGLLVSCLQEGTGSAS